MSADGVSALVNDLKRKHIPRLLKPQLKEVLKSLKLSGTGNKPDLQERLEEYLQDAARNRHQDVNRVFDLVRQQLDDRTYSGYSSPASSSRPIGSPRGIRLKVPPPSTTSAALATMGQLAGNSAVVNVHGSGRISQDPHSFKGSPFWEVEQKLSALKICDCRHANSSFKVDFDISAEKATRLQAALGSNPPPYQVMVFIGPYEVAHTPLSLQWPVPCELWVNNERVDIKKFTGLKGKPWTGQPADITRHCRLKHGGGRQRVELRVGQLPNKQNLPFPDRDRRTQRDQPTRFLMSVQTVTRVPIDTIVERIRSTKFIPKEQVLAERQQIQADDDDVVATSDIPVSLKDPASMVRMTYPARPSTCTHVQCFDCSTFFALNEQVPTWTCPICSKYIQSWESISIDGYFMDILQSVSEDVDMVEIRPDGSWYVPGDKKETLESEEKKETVDTGEVLSVDSDEEEIKQYKRLIPASSKPSTARPKPSPRKRTEPEVIDLTLSSDEEPEPPTARAHEQKGKGPAVSNGTTESSSQHVVKAESLETLSQIRTPSTENASRSILNAPTRAAPPTHQHPRSGIVNGLSAAVPTHSATGGGRLNGSMEGVQMGSGTISSNNISHPSWSQAPVPAPPTQHSGLPVTMPQPSSSYAGSYPGTLPAFPIIRPSVTSSSAHNSPRFAGQGLPSLAPKPPVPYSNTSIPALSSANSPIQSAHGSPNFLNASHSPRLASSSTPFGLTSQAAAISPAFGSSFVPLPGSSPRPYYSASPQSTYPSRPVYSYAPNPPHNPATLAASAGSPQSYIPPRYSTAGSAAPSIPHSPYTQHQPVINPPHPVGPPLMTYGQNSIQQPGPPLAGGHGTNHAVPGSAPVAGTTITNTENKRTAEQAGFAQDEWGQRYPRSRPAGS
ncbi:uncharacterized protein SPPG_08168 [Spizellomyces punctatus DAOM BR117]|uniref:SAP domain-containing protein n=1 Tax=Spizellomyces punctatus (strain DAOM BR117) TaxID=645134 RepID=A0A0L0H6J6_SPIPD|nr:uncharacterized protein SPPG_08168 [Spizellomyces punctatus DAOM BR117]KNC96584.1 hypothetical protein SPPG_08168 [Spizellomyces punctatus DAOM BR117]|eukprot:XP_016604624.1 hypothetical protein SPPG_08168 [Spizellomyces punctatus DAOM BR117]